MSGNLLAAFVHQAKTRPDSVATIVWHDEQATALTWSRLSAMVVDVAESLDANRIGFVSDNSLPDVVLPLACMAAGVMEVPFDCRLGRTVDALWKQVEGHWLRPEDRQQLIERAQSASVTPNDLARLEQASETIDPDAPAIILWTSGTTTSPKGVTLSHRNLVGNAQAKLNAVPQSFDDVRLTTLPICHAYARTCDYGTWLLSGCTLAVGLGYHGWQQLGPEVRPTLANTVPSMARRLINSDAKELGHDRLRLLGCGGAAMNDADFAAWRQRGVTVIQGYGLTETSPVICSATPDNATAGLVGDFVDDWEHQIRDGRLYVRGPHLMLGYWNDEGATAQRIDHAGWFDTGDMVAVDGKTKQIRILGRSDDVIVLSDGHKVHPQSVERDMESIDGIRHAMIVAADRDVHAWIDADDSIEIGVLRNQIAQALSSRPIWERPTRVLRLDPPLRQETGELTEKGAIRRARIMEIRGRLM